MEPATHSFTELSALEADGLVFSGYLHDGRALVPVLLKSQHSARDIGESCG